MQAGARVLVMGMTFKENCADTRNSKVIDIVHELEDYGLEVAIWDPVADAAEAAHEYGVRLADLAAVQGVSAVVAAVAHTEVKAVDLAMLQQKCGPGTPFIDVKSAFDRGALERHGFLAWRL
jgi:UDP-N-acetyl-D-galactosamine dehydrogenase